MSKKGVRRQQIRIAEQKIAKRENEAHYQHESDWKSPSSDREIAERRKI